MRVILIAVLGAALSALGCTHDPGCDAATGDDTVTPPGGTDLLFSAWSPVSSGGYGLWFASGDLEEPAPFLLHGEGEAGAGMSWASPCYLPSVGKLAMCGGDGTHIGLFTVGLDGSGVQRHTWMEDPWGDYGPFCPIACSPADPIVATSPDYESLYLVAVEQDGSPTVWVDVPFETSSLAWSADGASLVVSGDGIAIFALEDFSLTQVRSSGSDARMNRQGTQLTFVSPTDPEGVCVSDVDGSNEVRLSQWDSSGYGDFRYYSPRFTEDGAAVLYIADYEYEDADPCCSSWVEKARTDGEGQVTDLTEKLYLVRSFAITPDEDFVVVSGSMGGGFDTPRNYMLYRVPMNGSTTTPMNSLTASMHATQEYDPVFLAGGGW